MSENLKTIKKLAGELGVSKNKIHYQVPKISSAITHSSDLDVLRMAISTLNITLLNTNDCIQKLLFDIIAKKERILKWITKV